MFHCCCQSTFGWCPLTSSPWTPKVGVQVPSVARASVPMVPSAAGAAPATRLDRCPISAPPGSTAAAMALRGSVAAGWAAVGSGDGAGVASAGVAVAVAVGASAGTAAVLPGAGAAVDGGGATGAGSVASAGALKPTVAMSTAARTANPDLAGVWPPLLDLPLLDFCICLFPYYRTCRPPKHANSSLPCG